MDHMGNIRNINREINDGNGLENGIQALQTYRTDVYSLPIWLLLVLFLDSLKDKSRKGCSSLAIALVIKIVQPYHC